MKYLVLAPVIFGALLVLSCFMGRFLRGPATADREAVQDAPQLVLRTCSGCNAHEWEQHDPWCPNWTRVVAGSDLEWQLDLNRIYRDYDAYRLQHRLPGEGS